MKRVSDILRAAMVDAERHGVSLYRIAKQCDLDDSIVYRFYHDQCGLALSSVDRLAEFLHLELRSMDEGRAATAPSSRGSRLSTLEPPAKRVAKKRAAAADKPAAKKARASAKKKTVKPAKSKKKPRAK